VFYSPSGMHQQGKRGQLAEEGADMTGDDVHDVFEAILPQEEINRLCDEPRDVGARDGHRSRDAGRSLPGL
jgi:hypothetical protein